MGASAALPERVPSKKVAGAEREKLREMTEPAAVLQADPALIGELNRHLRGWANYFRFGYPRMAFREINTLRARAAQQPPEAPQPAALPTAGRGDLLPALRSNWGWCIL